MSADNLITRGVGIVGRLALFGGGQVMSGSAAPASGTSATPPNAPAGSLYLHTTTGAVYINEGTKASPYWTPVSYDQPGLRAWHTDFRSAVGKSITDTAATLILQEGVRVHGQGIAEAADSGLVVTYTAELGSIAALSTTNESAHLAALGVGTTVLPFQPDVHGPLVIDVEFTNNTAITDRANFCGFIGAAADALDPVCTGATTVITLVLDDLAGLYMDSGLTDSDGIFAPHNKSNEAATIATTATGVDVSKTIPAAATYTRWRVEISTAGLMTCFIDKVQVASIAASLDGDEEVAPVFYIEANAAAIKQVDVKRFATWGARA